MESKDKRSGILRPSNLVVAGVFVLLLLSMFWGYGQMKGPFSEAELREAQNGATRFINGEISVNKGKLLEVKQYFFTGTVYRVATPQGQKNLISFITPLVKPRPGEDVEWVGVGNYASSITRVYPETKTMDGEIISLERISPKNNDFFYCVVRELPTDKVQRFIIDAPKLQELRTLNSVHVSYRSPAESKVELVANVEKVAKGFITDLWLTTKIKTLELERGFDFAKYPYYMSVKPGPDAKYNWTFYLTKEQKEQVKLGNVVEVRYSSVFPTSITVTSPAVDPSVLTIKRDDGESS